MRSMPRSSPAHPTLTHTTNTNTSPAPLSPPTRAALGRGAAAAALRRAGGARIRPEDRGHRSAARLVRDGDRRGPAGSAWAAGWLRQGRLHLCSVGPSGPGAWVHHRPAVVNLF